MFQVRGLNSKYSKSFRGSRKVQCFVWWCGCNFNSRFSYQITMYPWIRCRASSWANESGVTLSCGVSTVGQKVWFIYRSSPRLCPQPSLLLYLFTHRCPTSHNFLHSLQIFSQHTEWKRRKNTMMKLLSERG